MIRSTEPHRTQARHRSAAVGNGFIARSRQMSSYYDMACSREGGAKTPILSSAPTSAWTSDPVIRGLPHNFAFDHCAVCLRLSAA
ncbi:unnamed protein product [Tilletia controversa]|uniref:Uncharacterized protein n=3 Tax=Tilletia TaxID=13289 RepID=A0A8X7SYJ9_9BASI|nr:hypothetical protein CF336_g3182 [Tilletia laevis]KAE8200579.1 hypothetical protein CF328_g2925 [Tilletia controversa]KAE8262254.1 hypothetical protein A4X03_0g2596 [Tilletia caries]KAE8205426.1 hypothetical protein CF335_g2305 [Tilletia laevis]KAE8249925.1 hypothetical protein A4X06_0g3005 [Tilletia controversa]